LSNELGARLRNGETVNHPSTKHLCGEAEREHASLGAVVNTSASSPSDPGYVDQDRRRSMFSYTSVLFSGIGALVGLWIGFKFSN
jgi:hypothetical protein